VSATSCQNAIRSILGLIGNVDHSRGNGANSAKMRGGMLNDIRAIALESLGKAETAPVGARYFKNPCGFWKFEAGESPAYRDSDDSEWSGSCFVSIDEMLPLAGRGGLSEITAEEGEP